VTGSNPKRAAMGVDAPDPWGVRRAENLLTTLEGILSARGHDAVGKFEPMNSVSRETDS
jgi:hypothetical protein